ncbi:DUF732 domain-containing protein [Nocardia asteroides]|uniref:DUF732 domain-containing protein n=1 Tax=Nocardia asteroides TaxID=1824 RepID=UPI001E5CFB32|nr:DUF732 domain-containing protein [Nocardia asteroides]UGT60326.1 DUF732 domain-containing protein [Nocardia asteroides]
MSTTRTHLRTLTVAAAIAFAALGGTVATAAADTGGAEVAFLEEIGINNATLPGKSADEMVVAGYQTCGHLRAGGSILDEISAVEQTYHFDQGTLFVSAASTNLCPDFAG